MPEISRFYGIVIKMYYNSKAYQLARCVTADGCMLGLGGLILFVWDLSLITKYL